MLEVGLKIQAKLVGDGSTGKLEKKAKVKLLAMLWILVSGVDYTTQVNALKYFNCFVIFAQRESHLDITLGYELRMVNSYSIKLNGVNPRIGLTLLMAKSSL